MLAYDPRNPQDNARLANIAYANQTSDPVTGALHGSVFSVYVPPTAAAAWAAAGEAASTAAGAAAGDPDNPPVRRRQSERAHAIAARAQRVTVGQPPLPVFHFHLDPEFTI